MLPPYPSDVLGHLSVQQTVLGVQCNSTDQIKYCAVDKHQSYCVMLLYPVVLNNPENDKNINFIQYTHTSAYTYNNTRPEKNNCIYFYPTDYFLCQPSSFFKKNSIDGYNFLMKSIWKIFKSISGASQSFVHLKNGLNRGTLITEYSVHTRSFITYVAKYMSWPWCRTCKTRQYIHCGGFTSSIVSKNGCNLIFIYRQWQPWNITIKYFL